MASFERIEEEARSLIEGDRNESYGPWSKEAAKIAAVWSALAGVPIKPEHVAPMMVGLKLVREGNRHKRDNLTDAIGYILLQDKMTDPEQP